MEISNSDLWRPLARDQPLRRSAPPRSAPPEMGSVPFYSLAGRESAPMWRCPAVLLGIDEPGVAAKTPVAGVRSGAVLRAQARGPKGCGRSGSEPGSRPSLLSGGIREGERARLGRGEGDGELSTGPPRSPRDGGYGSKEPPFPPSVQAPPAPLPSVPAPSSLSPSVQLPPQGFPPEKNCVRLEAPGGTQGNYDNLTCAEMRPLRRTRGHARRIRRQR